MLRSSFAVYQTCTNLPPRHLLLQPPALPIGTSKALILCFFLSLSIKRRSSVVSDWFVLCRCRDSDCSNMGLDEEFDQAAKDVKELTKKPSDEDLLILYGLFKVATVGKVDTARPGMFDMKGKAKWDAWKKVEDKAPEDAKKEYIAKVQQLQSA